MATLHQHRSVAVAIAYSIPRHWPSSRCFWIPCASAPGGERRGGRLSYAAASRRCRNPQLPVEQEQEQIPA
jgi:hypothetical protein